MAQKVMSLNDLKDSRLLYDKEIPFFGYMIITTILTLLIVVIVWSINTPKNYVIKSQGTIESTNKNYVMSPFTGEISDIYISEGMIVDVGDELLVIKSLDIDVQVTQLEEQKKIYEANIIQLEKLVDSIKSDTNLFNQTKSEDELYYSQYEVYKSQVEQSQPDTALYEAYGYTEEQIDVELEKNQAKITEIYYSAIQSAQNNILETKSQIDNLDAQLAGLNKGQSEYVVTANTSGQMDGTS